MDKDVLVFFSGAGAGLLAYSAILLFKNLLRNGRQIRRRLFIGIMTGLMAVCGLIIGLIIEEGPVLVIVMTLSTGAIGAIISLVVSLALYKHK